MKRLMATTHVDTWESCLSIIRKKISPDSYDTWFHPVKPLKLDQAVLTIQVPSQFFYEFLEEHFIHVLREAVHAVLGPDGRLEYSIVIDPDQEGDNIRLPGDKDAPDSNRTISLDNHHLHAERPIPNPFIIPGIRKFEIDSNLNPSYTFKNYIEGDCNRLARTASYAITNKPGLTAYNPLFLFGGVGLGKTHLLQAIGNEIKAKFPKKAVLYISSERFVNQFVDAVRNSTVNDFMRFYQMLDVLLVDDIQFFEGKTKTQDYFFHVFNALYMSQKQIVMASDRPPSDMRNVEERLLTRFKFGLNVQLSNPDVETRRTILRDKMYQNGIELPSEVVDYVANHISSNIRELEGAMISLLAQSSLNKVDISLELARSLVAGFANRKPREITIELIQQAVGDYYNISVEDMQSKSRRREITQARQVAMYFAKEMTSLSLKGIGKHFGGRDHSTVIHGIQTVKDLSETDREYRDKVEEVRKQLEITMI
jgi:chromosomal replication initiator protein